MEIREYYTNVLSIDHFASINYEFYQELGPEISLVRQHLRTTEAFWRKKNALVICDQVRDGIWLFKPEEAIESTSSKTSDVDFIVSTRELLGITLSLTENGQYQPACLAQSQPRSTNSTTAPSNASPPSSVLDTNLHNAHIHNARAVHANRALNVVQDTPSRSYAAKEGAEGTEARESKAVIHENFISAALNSITYRLCRYHAYIPLNPRTLVVPSANVSVYAGDDGGSKDTALKLASLDISVSSMGTLIIKTSVDRATSLLCCRRLTNTHLTCVDIVTGTAIWLAPMGHPARFHRLEQPNSLELSRPDQMWANSPDSEFGSQKAAATQYWKSMLLDWLHNKGLDPVALEEGGWILARTVPERSSVVLSNDRTNIESKKAIVVPWPALLCYQYQDTVKSERQRSESYLENWKDPLSFAEEWFASKDERANIIARRQKDRQAEEVLDKIQADAENHISRTTTIAAAALRRGSNAGAMYPTPPDAIQGHNVGVTPSMDGAGSTPGKAQVSAQDETTGPESGLVRPEALPSDDARLPTDSSVTFNENDNDNLFGEIEADLFVDTDITDADFSFFDQPDELVSDLSVKDMSLVTDTAMELNMPEKQKSGAHANTRQLPVTSNEEPVQIREARSDLEGNSNDDALITTSNIIPSPAGRRSQQEAEFRKPLLPNSVRPFDKIAVYNKLQYRANTVRKEERRSSIFEKVDFREMVASDNEKYSLHGRFRLPAPSDGLEPKVHSGIPETIYLRTRRSSRSSEHKKYTHWKGMKDAELHGNDLLSTHHSQSPTESDASSLSSDTSSLSSIASGPLFLFNPGTKRKRDVRSEFGDDIKTPSMSVHGLDQSIVQSTDERLLFLEEDRACWSLTPFLTSAEPEAQSTSLPDLEYIETAQILADQAVSRTLRWPKFAESPRDGAYDDLAMHRNLLYTVSKAASAFFEDLSHCKLHSFLEIPGIPIVTLRQHPRPTPNPRSLGLDTMKQNNPFQIHPPQLGVRRSESPLSILPSAIPFWENLGLGPSAGSKDVCAVCVYPDSDGVAERASKFLDQMRSFYESYRFGSHERIGSEGLNDSLLAFTVTNEQKPNTMHHLTMLKETTARLSNVLLSMHLHDKNIVVYFIYPVGDPTLLVHICCAFKHLFDLYRLGLAERRMSSRNELVLQLVSLDFIASPNYHPMPSPSEYGRLAMEVYDRCVEFTTSMSSPAILLEKALPKSIDFKLTSQPSPSLLQENTCIHVAYAQSLDNRWITAAWTDNQGEHQMTASYCLGRKNQPIISPFSDVANEIWETTLQVVRSIKVHWRIFIVKVGAMEPHEIDTWKSYTSPELHPLVNLTLATVQTDPSLRLMPEATTSSSPPSTSVPTIPTPVSTPQTTGPSTFTSIITTDTVSTPTRETVPGTPIDVPSDTDTDARLVDLTDQAWGAILSHRLNNSNSLLDIRPTLISGYLIKRGGTESSDMPLVLEVNIIHSEVVGNPRTFHESLLRELLGYYRGLATLASVKGVVHPVRDGRPWHIAAVEKGVKALYTCM